MRILVLHLSDIHFKTENDPILDRIDDIINATKNLDYETSKVLVLLTGDLTFSGQDDQYEIGMQFFEDISNGLRHELGLKSSDLKFVLVPGNHDCDFSGAGKIRSVLIKALLEGEATSSDEDLVSTCLQVQEGFRVCRDLMMDGIERESICEEIPQELAYSVTLWDALRVFCINTSWLSQLKEKPGELLVPNGGLPSFSDAKVTMVVFHHPYNWLEPNNSRDFRGATEAVADLALSGHEHQQAHRQIAAAGGIRSTHIEGGALQLATEPTESAFNALSLDIDQSKYKFAQFIWAGDRYELGSGSLAGQDGSGLRWEAYPLNRTRFRSKVILRDEVRRHLEDPGLLLAKGSRETTLEEIYVPPDLLEVPADRLNLQEGGKLLPGSQLFDDLLARDRVLITGDDQSGKSALAKRLFAESVFRGFLPILLTSEDRLPPGESLFGYLEERFEGNYERPDLITFRQADRSERIVIFDDFHRTKMSKRSSQDILPRLTKFAGRVFVFAHDFANVVDELLVGDGKESFDHVQILPLGHVKRHELAENWFTRRGAKVKGAADLARQVVHATRILDRVIGRNLVPAHPIYLLSVLQAVEENVGLDVRIGSHGYYYELLIRTNLIRRRSGPEYDFLIGCLSWLAYRLLREGRTELPTAKAVEWLRDYEEQFDIEVAANKFLDELTRDGVLGNVRGQVSFKYPYLRYFFVARYMAGNLSDEEVREQVRELAGNVQDEDAANILLFMSHLSRDPFILNNLLFVASDCFKDSVESSLEEDELGFLGEVRQITGLVLEEKDPSQYQRERAERRDRGEELEGDDSPSGSEESELGSQDAFNAALKSLQMIGEFLKSFPATLEAERKLEVARAAYSLGRRICGEIQQLLRANRQELVERIVQEARFERPELDREEAVKAAEGALLWLARAANLGVIKRVSAAIGAPELGKTYDKLRGEDRSVIVDLFDVAIRLEQVGGVPVPRIKELSQEWQKKPFGLSLLKLLVIEHLYMFEIDYRYKQQVCKALGVEYRPVRIQTTDQRRLKARAN